MNLATYARRNLFRRRGRTILTLVAVALAVVIYSLIQTLVAAWNAGAEDAARDRIATRHKVSITMQLPKRYIDDIRDPNKIKGVKAATWANWFGGKDPRERAPFFAAFAADPDSWFDVMDEMKVEPAVLETWKKTPDGVIIGDLLAKSLEVKPGDDVTITSDIYPGDWKFKVVGLYTPLRATADRNSFVFHWEYLNKDPRNLLSKDQIGWVMARIDDSSRSAEISRAIDKLFEERDVQTLTMSERAFQIAFTGGFSAVLNVFEVVSIAILLIMCLILANTVAMSVRERTNEYGVLRAIGFTPKYIFGFILGESFLIALVGAAIGAVVSMGFINGLIGPGLENGPMGALFPRFRAPSSVLFAGFLLATLGGLLAGLVPALRTSRHKVTDALRRVD